MYRRYRRRRVSRRRKRSYGRKRYSRKRFGGSRYNNNSSIVRIRRSTTTTIAGNDAYAPYIPSSLTPGIVSYQLDDLVNYQEFTNLFEEYRIVGVKHRFHLRRQPDTTTTTTSTTNTYPTLYYSTIRSGYTSDLLPAGLTDMLEDASTQMRVLTPDKPVTIYHRVYGSNPTQGSTLTDAFTVEKGAPWQPCRDGGIKAYYGMKFAIDEHRNPNNFVDVVNTYYLQFRGAR